MHMYTNTCVWCCVVVTIIALSPLTSTAGYKTQDKLLMRDVRGFEATSLKNVPEQKKNLKPVSTCNSSSASCGIVSIAWSMFTFVLS